MEENDVCKLGLTLGQQRILMEVVKNLKETKAKEDSQEIPSDGRKMQSRDENGVTRVFTNTVRGHGHVVVYLLPPTW
ncbi:hypothetical protein E2C01_043560 [Portunus trituberculatus]|uniref:Uncharacterized protein n=1 Tax=Portunus trituberculatus TaxID=210409 RepID=A0A5B7FXW5_PORTR|nr:hypothetical protein [Portunus trituberculatus]